MKILHIVPSFYPATLWGGPIFSTKSLCDWAALEAKIEVKVLSTDAAGPELSARLRLDQRTIKMEAGYHVTYFRRILGHSISPGLFFALPRAILRADIVHLSATYSFPTLPTLFFARVLRRPVVWSPRGAIQASHEWESAPNRRIKRKFERLARLIAPSCTVLLVTAKSEADATAKRMPGMRIEVVPNSVSMPVADEIKMRKWRPNGSLRLLFLSRVHRKKGIDVLISAMSQLEDYVTLDIYGSGEAEYINELRAQVEKLGLEGRIHFRGHVDGSQKAAAFRNADLFVLPSHSENFGIAIAEALAHGVPVVTTISTPWAMLDVKDCGRLISPNTIELAECIRELSRADLRSMGRRGRAWMECEYGRDVVNKRLWGVYESLLDPSLHSYGSLKNCAVPSSRSDVDS